MNGSKSTLYLERKKKPELGKLSEIGFASIPFISSLLMLVVDDINNYVLAFLILILFSCSVILLLYRIKDGLNIGNYGSISFILGFIVWYSYPAFVTFFFPSYQLDIKYTKFIDKEIYLLGIVYISVFLTSGVLASFLFNPYKYSKFKFIQFVSNRETNPRIIIIFALSLFSLGIMSYFYWESNFMEIISDIIESRAIEKPWLQSSNLGDAISPFSFAISSAMVSATFLMWTFTIDKRASMILRAFGGLVALLSTLIIYFDQGTRAIFLMIIIPAVAVKITLIKRESSSASILLFLLFITFIFFAVQFQALYRASFSREFLPELFFEKFLILGGTIDYFKETLFAISLVPDYHDYFKESALLHFIISPIPRIIWPDKPASELVWFYTFFRWNIDIYTQSGNVLPGIIGQYYMSWGWLGPIIIGAILGVLTKYLDLILSKINIENDPYKFALGIFMSVWIIISYRLLSPAFFYPIVMSYVIIFFSSQRKIKKI